MASNTDNSLVERAYALKNTKEAAALYDKWADTYDKDLLQLHYISPIHVAEAVAKYGNIKGLILDAGCGTGMCGNAMARLGAKTIDGNDISPGMLKTAEKTGVYRQLTVTDLSKGIEVPDRTYDIVTCVGTLTHGHVGPVPALKEFVRITKGGGVVIGTVHEDLWESGGYEEEVLRLQKEGFIDFISADKKKISEGADAQVRIIILKVLI